MQSFIDSMDVFDAIESRITVKVYDKRDVPDEFISQILTAGTMAASAGDLQPWEFVVVKEKKIKKEISIAALSQKHVEDAPVVIVVCVDLQKSELRFKERGKELYALQDSGAVAQNMLLTAHTLGLGASWVRAFEEDRVKALVHLPDNLRPIGIITVGFPIPYEKYPKTEVVPYENVSWSDQYGKELSWIKKYGRKSRYELKSAYEYSKELAEKVSEKMEEKQVKQTVIQKVKDFFSKFKKK